MAEGISVLSEVLGEYLDPDVAKNMTEIATAVNATKAAEFTLVFDPTLVRGMSYYTGTIFELPCFAPAIRHIRVNRYIFLRV